MGRIRTQASGRWQRSSGRCGERLNQQTRPNMTRTLRRRRRSGKQRRRLMPRRGNLLRRPPRVGTKRTRRRRRPRTANRKGKVESCQKEPKGAVTNSPHAEEPERLPGAPLSRPYFDTSSLKYVFQNMYFDSILFKIRIFKIRTLKYLSS